MARPGVHHIHSKTKGEAMTKGITFLYPTSRQFPFDEVCEKIVRALEERGWNVPGITVEFNTYGNYRMVRTIKGSDFKLEFGRIQANLGHWNDTAAITGMTIPRKDLNVYEDNSGPTLYVYVGNNWQRDAERFTNHIKVNSRLNGERRWYLKYSGSCDCRASRYEHTHPHRRSPILLHDNDLNREYSPNGREPAQYNTDKVFDEFTRWLNANVLKRILRVSPKK